jgi:hypothetical protein
MEILEPMVPRLDNARGKCRLRCRGEHLLPTFVPQSVLLRSKFQATSGSIDVNLLGPQITVNIGWLWKRYLFWSILRQATFLSQRPRAR